jgi:hypothetical protein
MFEILGVFCLLGVAFSAPINPIVKCNGQSLTEIIESLQTSASFTLQTSLASSRIEEIYNELSNLQDGTTDKNTYNICNYVENTSEVSKHAMCSWVYECDYEEGRFPQYIFHARCTEDKFSYMKQLSASNGDTCQCGAVYRPIQVLRFSSCNPETDIAEWKWESYQVSVGCQCS